MRYPARQPALPSLDPGPSARVRQAAGESAERWVRHVHRLCELRDLAWVIPVSTHYRPVPGGKVVPVRAGTIDCLGLLRGGRALGVEVKSCSQDFLDFARLPPQQRAHLERIEQLGGVALVLCVGPKLAWPVEWSRIRQMLAAGAKGLGLTPRDEGVISRLRPHPYLARWAA